MDNEKSYLGNCNICPRRCGVNRLAGQTGYCGLDDKIIIAFYGPHFGEEPPLTGKNGSGNIFFSSCNLRCLFCQNYQISHSSTGKIFSIEGLVKIFFELQEQGCHNINLVSPTPYIPHIASAMAEARHAGLSIPFVYNTHAYENIESLRMLDGLVDIYLPDFKYWSGVVSGLLSGAADYPFHARQALKEMYLQTGNLTTENGIGKTGMIIRHLVLPNNLAGSKNILRWIEKEFGKDIYISLMAQYSPLYRASAYPMLNRKVLFEEYMTLIDFVSAEGFKNVFIQDPGCADLLIPDFDTKQPFERTWGKA